MKNREIKINFLFGFLKNTFNLKSVFEKLV